MKTHKTMLKNQSVFSYPWGPKYFGSGHAGLAKIIIYNIEITLYIQNIETRSRCIGSTKMNTQKVEDTNFNHKILYIRSDRRTKQKGTL